MSTAEKDVHQSMADTMTPAEKARADAIMKGWLAFNDQAKEIEQLFDNDLESIGREVGELVCRKLGIEKSPVADRNLEFGRLIADTFRTYQMRMPYTHQSNDALIKEQLKTFDLMMQKDMLPEMIQHDLDSMYEILHERVYWVEQTGDLQPGSGCSNHPNLFP